MWLITEIKKHWIIFLFGGLFSLILWLLISLWMTKHVYVFNPLPKYYRIIPQDSLKKMLINDSIKPKIDSIDEKMSSLNTRFNDLYTLGAIIIALILAIVGGIYIKTSHEVKKHLDDNFSDYDKQLKQILDNAKSISGTIKAQSLAENSIPNTNQNVTNDREPV